jgi:hypothetical protein
VAPGITVKIEVELKANHLGKIPEGTEVRIETESEIFRIPVYATIVEQEAQRLAKGVRLLPSNSSNPSSPSINQKRVG